MLESVLFHRDWSKNNRHGLIACVCHTMAFLLFSVGSVLDSGLYVRRHWLAFISVAIGLVVQRNFVAFSKYGIWER